jgi:hypothetical protein
MKFLAQLLAILVLGFLFELFFPWWSIAVAAAIGGYVLNTRANFFAGFLGIALLWTIKALLIDLQSSAPLADQVAAIFKLQSKMLLYVVMAVLGGLVGGFAAWTGSLLRAGKRTTRYV